MSEQFNLFAALESVPVQPVIEEPGPVELAVPGMAIPATEAPDCDLSAFIRSHGRVPFITDERKPWTYQGWMMHYRMACEDHGITPPRWDYWARTMFNGALLDEPIPLIEFAEDCSERSEGYKVIDKAAQAVGQHFGEGSLRNLLQWLMFALGISKELPEFPASLHEHLYRTIDLKPLLKMPSDYFGTWISVHKGKWNPTAFFPTPHSVVEMIVRITYGDGDHRAAEVNDCCLGTGRFLLHASNYSLRLYGNDIDHIVLMAAKVNGALYAPWMVRPFPQNFFASIGTPVGVS